MYIQETGRAGRDDSPAYATLYYNRHDISGAVSCHTGPAMKGYCNNSSECRRRFLMRIFSSDGSVKVPSIMHECCDICSRTCSCSDCVCSPMVSPCNDISLEQLLEDNFSMPGMVQIGISKKEQRDLVAKLLALRIKLCSTFSNSGYLLVGPVICTGLSEKVIKEIAKLAHTLRSEEDLLSLGITSRIYCPPILALINEFTSAPDM